MKIGNLPKPDKPLDLRYLRALNIKSYDADNLYPQNVRNIILGSKTGSGCLERYADYIEGRGIASESLAAFPVNLNGETLADIHAQVARDVAPYDGFALHVNYDINANIVSIHSIPFENVRLLEPDEEGVVRKVALHPDWSGKTTRGGKPVPVKAETIDIIDVFNPDPEVVLAQMQEAGGPQFYKGQVFYYSREGHLQYPFSPVHSVLPDMSTDEGISNVLLRNARNNFMPSGAFVRLKGQRAPEFDENGDLISEPGDEGYAEDLLALQGDQNACKILDIIVESKDEMPEFLNFQGNNYDKEFTQTAIEVKDAIYARFGQEGWLAIRNGKVGFSGTLVADVERDYAKRQIKLQKAITRCYVSILSAWTPANPLPEEPTREALTIIPLVDIDNPQPTAE